MEGNFAVPARGKEDGAVAPVGPDPHNPPPSRVVHVRGVPDGCREHDLSNASCAFGTVSFVLLMPRQRQALIEMSTADSAVSLVQYSQNNPILVLGRRVYMNFSKSQEIIRDRAPPSALAHAEGEAAVFRQQGLLATATMGQPTEPGATNILLITVQNPLYPINTEVMHTITSPHGQVLRIVISRKGPVQAFVEFDSIGSAVRAKQNLNGADIYASCCTLRIEYSRATKLNVRRNDDDSWDYTWAMAGPGPAGPLLRQPIGPFPTPAVPFDQRGPPVVRTAYNPALVPRVGPPTMPFGMEMGMPGGSPVLMIYNVGEKFNCNHLFNLFCLYGNVLKIKFLLNKQGSAMVHMGDVGAADLAMQHLNRITVMGCKLDISHSKHQYIAGMTSITLADGSPSCVDYTQSPLNRFNKLVLKNRVYRPSSTLHFFNAPPDLVTDQVQELLTAAEAPTPTGIKIFDKETTRNATGLIDWPTLDAALTALALANHQTIKTANGGQYTFKLAFSSNPSDREPRR